MTVTVADAVVVRRRRSPQVADVCGGGRLVEGGVSRAREAKRRAREREREVRSVSTTSFASRPSLFLATADC